MKPNGHNEADEPTAVRPANAPRTGRTTIAGIELELVVKRVKRLSLRVYPPDGRVRVTVPHGTPPASLATAVGERADWIRRQQERFRSLPQPLQVDYVTGETHYVAGEPRRLVLERGRPGRVRLEGRRLVLEVSGAEGRDARAKWLEAWLRRQLKVALPPLVEEWSARFGVEPPEHRVKRMRTRWGSCNPRARRIWVNLALAQRRPALLEYIVVHEIAHLLVADHGPRFRALMSRHLPEWRALDRELDEWPLWAHLPDTEAA